MPSHSRPVPTFRAAGVTATATTLVALVAMSTLSALAATGAPGHATRALEVESRLEGHVVRAVTAAVVARMRDLLASEHPTAAVAVLEVWAETGRTAMSRLEALCDTRGGSATLLGERLLDLPPPAC